MFLNADWLKLAYHSKQEFPDYPLVNISYEDMEKDFNRIKKEVIRFAGEESFSDCVCSHWRPISKAGCLALRDNGIKIINATGGAVKEYTGDQTTLPYGHSFRLIQNRQPETKLFTRISLNNEISSSICAYNHLTQEQLEETNCNLKTVIDKETGINFKQLLTHGTIVNLSEIDAIESEYSKFLDCEFVGLCGHEQYFYPDYYAYQENHEEKLLKACRIMQENGFEFIFADELVK